jgi:hypothetical protein
MEGRRREREWLVGCWAEEGESKSLTGDSRGTV